MGESGVERWGQTEFQVNLKLGLTPCPNCLEMSRPEFQAGF